MPSEEAKVLLHHPSALERALALKLDSITPEDIAVAIRDPDERVFKAAFNHPNSSHALEVLAASSRDAAGNPIHHRHDQLLADPRCHNGHIESIKRSVQNDTFLPIEQQAARLKVLGLRAPLLKKELDRPRLANAEDTLERVVAPSQEENKFPELLKHYNKAVNSTNPISPQHADLHQVGVSPKLIYHIPDEETKETHKFIVKPYLEEELPLGGWAEGTSQDVYHAGGLGHLHQKSFVGSYDNGDRHIPTRVIHIEKSSPIHKVPQKEILEKNPTAPEDARKIALMDFLTGNGDRHTNNLMVKPDGQLLAIDHGQAFTYEYPEGVERFGDPKYYKPTVRDYTNLGQFTRKATHLLTNHGEYEWGPSLFGSGERASFKGDNRNVIDSDYHKTIKHWWPTVGPDIKRAFDKRLELIQKPAIKRHVAAGFNARHQWLNEMAGVEPEQFQQELKKSVENTSMGHSLVEKYPLTVHRYESVHKELVGTYPKHLQPNVNRFEKFINDPNKVVQEVPNDFGGVERKSLVKHGTQKYLIKGANTKYNPLSAWGELASQAMYHAGGIGHLHQHSHATNLNVKQGSNTIQQPAVAVHFQPGKWQTLSDYKRRDNGTKVKDFYNKHGEDLRKIYLMDFLTGNDDRHDENVLVGPNGEPQAIDQAFAFRRDNHDIPKDQGYNDDADFGGLKGRIRGGISPFNLRIFARDHGLGVNAHNSTHAWWLQNKEPIVKVFNKFLDMIPDKEERDRRRGMFDYRVNALDNKHPDLFNDPMDKSEDLAKGSMSRLHQFNPRAQGTPETYSTPINDWVAKENPQAREQLGLMGMEPNAKARALNKLHANTEVRKNPKTNEREFLLHRGFGATQLHTLKTPGKYDSTAPRTDKKKTGRAIPYTSWSVDPNETHTSDHMVSAWIPESNIAFYLPQYNKLPGTNETAQQLSQDEKEAIVEPGQFDIFHQDRGRDWLMGLKQKIQGLHKSEGLSKGSMQRLFPYNPIKEGGAIVGENISRITGKPYPVSVTDTVMARTGGDDVAREILTDGRGISPNVIQRGLHKLHSLTSVRRGVEGREFLLYRGYGKDEKHLDKPFHYVNPNFSSSWTPQPEVAKRFASHGLVQAWIPEKAIKAYLPKFHVPSPVIRNQINDEQEVVVGPGRFEKKGGLAKTLSNASYLHDQHTAFPTQQGMQANMKGVHEKLMKAVPAAVGPGIRHFEIAINQSKNPVKPVAEQKDLEGLQPKALYAHNGKKYLVKPAVENSTAMGAWNEGTSMNLYHAGNIGHLHQKVHFTIGQTGLNRSEPAHAVVVHMEPNSMTFNDATGWEDEKGNKYAPKDIKRYENLINTPEHMESLRRIGMMDYLTGNGDRHGANIVLAPDGSPVAIDHGRSFHPMRKHALGRETSTELYSEDLQGTPYDHEAGFLQDPGYRDQFIPDYQTHMQDSLAAQFGGEPQPETWKWWHENSKPIMDKFIEHVNMLPDPEQRAKMYRVFKLRHDRLNSEFK